MYVSLSLQTVMGRTSLLQLPDRRFTNHCSGLHGPLSPPLNASTEHTPRISLPNCGKISCINTIEIFIAHEFFKRIWICKWISISYKIKKKTLLVGLRAAPSNLTSKDWIRVFDVEHAQYWANKEAKWWDEVVRWGSHKPIDQSHRYGRHQAACREPAGSYDKTTRTAICFEHKTQYLLIRAPYTRIVVFWPISNIPPMISQSQISCNTHTFYIAAISVKYCYTTGSWLL